MINPKLIEYFKVLRTIYPKRSEYYKILKTNPEIKVHDIILKRVGTGIQVHKSEEWDKKTQHISIDQLNRNLFNKRSFVFFGEEQCIRIRRNDNELRISYIGDDNIRRYVDFNSDDIFNESLQFGFAFSYDDVEYIVKNTEDIKHDFYMHGIL